MSLASDQAYKEALITFLREEVSRRKATLGSKCPRRPEQTPQSSILLPWLCRSSTYCSLS